MITLPQIYTGNLEYSSLMPNPDRWVKATDYEALAAQLAARNKQIAVLWDVLARSERMFALANEAMAALAPDAGDGSAVDRGGEHG